MFDVPPSIRKPDLYVEARTLRKQQGMPIKRIATRLGISPATAHRWVKDIELTAEEAGRNLYGPTGPLNRELVARRAASWARVTRDRRRAWQEEGRARAREGDLLHMAGCMLYWAEGSKGKNVAELVNSDMQLMRMWRRFLAESLGVSPDRMVVTLNVYLGNGLTLAEIESRWLSDLALSRVSLRRHVVDHRPTSSSGRRRNRLPYGVCSLRVLKSTPLVQHIYGAIQEYGGFVEPQWLDGYK